MSHESSLHVAEAQPTAAPPEPSSLEAIVLPKEAREGWERALAGGHNDRVLRALYRVALGESFREAATGEGYRDHADIWRLAKRYGIAAPGKAQILESTRRIARLADDELEHRLVEKPEDISDRDLIVAGGVAKDKLANAEGWGKSAQGPNDYQSALEQLAARIVESGATLELRVSRREEDNPVVDMVSSAE